MTHATEHRIPNFKKPNPQYLKVREIASRAVWMLDNRILDIDYDGDLPTDIAAVVLKVVRDEIEALIHTGGYYGPGEADVDSLDFYDVLGMVSDG